MRSSPWLLAAAAATGLLLCVARMRRTANETGPLIKPNPARVGRRAGDFLAGQGAPGGSGSPSDSTDTYATELLSDTREELTRADSKAQLLLAATGVAVGALLAGFIRDGWQPSELDDRVEWLWWLGVVAAGVGITSLGSAVYPRTRRRRGESVATSVGYYADVVTFAGATELRAAIAAAAGDAGSWNANQLLQVSRIVATKYRLIRVGMWSLAIAGLSTAAATLLNATVLA